MKETEKHLVEALRNNADHFMTTDYEWSNALVHLLLDSADAIEELLAELETMRHQLPHWISVEERLPEVATKVLTYSSYVTENWRCTIADKDGKREVWAYSEGFVIHWMPLPEPPKEVE